MEDRNQYYAEKLAALIRVETVSENGFVDVEKFRNFHAVLKKQFPHVFSAVRTEDFNGSLLLYWQGKSHENPILLMSHHDVVGAGDQWEHDPFGGEIIDGKLWGRGTLDTKGSLFAMLQAAEELIEQGFVPPQDIWIESACTEETDGSGAETIAGELEKRGIRFSLVLDEGGMIVYDPIGGAEGFFAMMGVGEKGAADLKFIARSDGGHASMPGKNTPLVRLGKFMAAAEKSKCFRCELSSTVAEMFRRFASCMGGAGKLLFANAKILRKLLCAVMPGISPAAGAMLKTTLAFTMAGGSDGRNVLPQEAWVIGNMRFSHHQGQQDSFAKIKALAKKYHVDMEILDPGQPSGITDYRHPMFCKTEQAVRRIFPGVVPTPYVMTGASDCRYMDKLSDCCIRFAPFTIDDAQLASIHGRNENVDVSTLAPAVDFYKFIIEENSNG